MAWIKHQKQTINGTEYEYWYVYKTYYEPGMDHPHQVKLGKVGESASELANCLREKGKDKGWDVSEEEIQELEDTVKEAQEMAEDDEDIAEQIEKISGEAVEAKDEEEDDSERESEEQESKDYPERAEQHALVAPVKVSWSGKTREKVRSDLQHVDILDPVFESQKTNIVVETEEQVNELLFRLHAKVKAEGEVWSTNNQKAIKRVYDEIVDELEEMGYVIQNHKIQDLEPSNSEEESEKDSDSNIEAESVQEFDAPESIADFEVINTAPPNLEYEHEGRKISVRAGIKSENYVYYKDKGDFKVSVQGNEVVEDDEKYFNDLGKAFNYLKSRIEQASKDLEGFEPEDKSKEVPEERPSRDEDGYNARIGDKISIKGTPVGEFASREGEWVIIDRKMYNEDIVLEMRKSGKRKEVLAGGYDNQQNEKLIKESELEKEVNQWDEQFGGSHDRNAVLLVERGVESDRINYENAYDNQPEPVSVKNGNNLPGGLDSEKLEEYLEEFRDSLDNEEEELNSSLPDERMKLVIDKNASVDKRRNQIIEAFEEGIDVGTIKGSVKKPEKIREYDGDWVFAWRPKNKQNDRYIEIDEALENAVVTDEEASVKNVDEYDVSIDDATSGDLGSVRSIIESEGRISYDELYERSDLGYEDQSEALDKLENLGLIEEVEDEVYEYLGDERIDEDEDFDSMQAVKKLTRMGIMVGRDAPKEIRPGDVEIIESLDVTPMYVNAEMLNMLREHNGEISGSKTVDIETGDIEYSNVEIIGDVPEFMGVDGDVYGDYDGGEQVTLPDDNAEILVNRGLAERVEDEEDSSVKNDESSESSDDQSEENDSMDTEEGYVEVEFLQKTPQFMGTDLEQYGGFEKGDVAEIPEDNAEILENRGNVEVKGGIANGAEEHNQSSRDKNGQDSSSEGASGEIDKEDLDRLRELIHDLDDGDGADYSELAEKDFVSEELIQNLLDLGDAYEPRPGKIKLLDFSNDSETVSKEEVFSKVNDRDYDKFQEAESVFAFNHKQTGKDIWFEGKESKNSGDNYLIYSDIVGVLQDNGVIDGVSPEKEYSDKEEALDDLRLMTMNFNNNYGDYLDDYKDEESVDEKDMRQLENKVVDYLDENFSEDGNGIKYETLKSKQDGIGNWMEINGFTEDMLEDAINNLLSDGTLYEPAPGKVKKL